MATLDILPWYDYLGIVILANRKPSSIPSLCRIQIHWRFPLYLVEKSSYNAIVSPFSLNPGAYVVLTYYQNPVWALGGALTCSPSLFLLLTWGIEICFPRFKHLVPCWHPQANNKIMWIFNNGMSRCPGKVARRAWKEFDAGEICGDPTPDK